MRSPARWREPTDAGIDRGITVKTTGPVPAVAVARAVYGISRVLRSIDAVSIAHLRITRHRRDLQAMVFQVNASINGRRCRVQIACDGSSGADRTVERLDQQLDRLMVAQRPELWQRPTSRALAAISVVRPIVRHKIYRPLVLSPAGASEVLDAMDFDAYLFRDRDTGEDAIVYRAGPTDTRLLRQSRVDLPAARDNRIAVDLTPTAMIPATVAAKRLCGNGLPFLFFVDPETARGQLLYRRYDGDLALITTAPEYRRP